MTLQMITLDSKRFIQMYTMGTEDPDSNEDCRFLSSLSLCFFQTPSSHRVLNHIHIYMYNLITHKVHTVH